jgi:hypothetical protein
MFPLVFELVDRNGISPRWNLQSGDLIASVSRTEFRLPQTGDNTKYMEFNDELTSYFASDFSTALCLSIMAY